MDDLKLIKKYYGENMMHLCRTLFPTILETKGLLFSLLEKNFAYTRHLYNDIIEYKFKDEFKEYIYSLLDENKEDVVETPKSVRELLDEANYVLYECKTEEDIQSFKKYYIPKEELCTFDGGRLENCYVFFAVKKDVDRIKRIKFPKPERDDAYGISVISIQFSRGGVNTLSIKNRYNHTVENPDATFSNNLENIIPGLTKSFEREYGLNINQNGSTRLNLPDYGYVKADDGKYYKYNYEINNIYYGADNVIIDNFRIKKYEKEKYLIIDYFILDLVNKKISLYDPNIKDSFIDDLTNIEKIEINNIDSGKIIKIVYDIDKEAIIEIDKQSRMISYKNNNIKEISENFLAKNIFLKKISLEKTEKIGDCFLERNLYADEINLPNAITIGNNCCESNTEVKELKLEKVTTIGNNFFHSASKLQKINVENVEKIGDYFLFNSYNLEEILLPKATIIGDYFLHNNSDMIRINLEKATIIGNKFMFGNCNLKEINVQNVEKIGDYFLYNNKEVQEIDISKATEIGTHFLFYDKKLQKINLSNELIIGSGFLGLNKKLFKLKFLLSLKSQIINNNLSKGRNK